MILGVTRRHYMSVSVVQVKPVKSPRRRKYGICNPSSKRCVQHNMKAHTKTKQIPELPMSGPMRAIHSLAAAPAAPAPATETATRPLRRRTSAARASRESSRQPQALPDLPSRRAALLALVLAGSTPRPPTAAAAFSLGIRTNTSLDSALVAARRRPCSHLFSSPVVLAVVVCWDAAAGPKELLREQKKKSARFLLAPIAASREILLKAQSLLGNSI